MHRASVKHSGLTDREVRDVDALLDLALALGADLAHFQSDQLSQGGLLLAEGVADLLPPLFDGYFTQELVNLDK